MDGRTYNIAKSIKTVIDVYVDARKKEFIEFMGYCEEISRIRKEEPQKVVDFIKNLLRDDVDARIFEIVSYAILKEYYSDQKIYWGWEQDDLTEENLILYKTGKTNANDWRYRFRHETAWTFFSSYGNHRLK